MWRNFRFLYMANGEKSGKCSGISDFSTWQMWRIVKSWQLWRNLLFLHMTDFSPHVSHLNYVTNIRYVCIICKRWRHYNATHWWRSLYLNGLLSCPSGARPVACLLKTVPKWLDDCAEKILRLDETPNLQQRAGSRNFQSTTLYWKDSQWISWIVSKVLSWPVSDSVNVVLSTAWSSFFTLMGLINFC